MVHTRDPCVPAAGRLRFVYDDGVISLRLRSPPTFGEVASAMGHLAHGHHAAPRAIDLRLDAPTPAVAPGMGKREVG